MRGNEYVTEPAYQNYVFTRSATVLPGFLNQRQCADIQWSSKALGHRSLGLDPSGDAHIEHQTVRAAMEQAASMMTAANALRAPLDSHAALILGVAKLSSDGAAPNAVAEG